MVYHEIRIVNGKKLNYLVYNSRKNAKWKKISKYIGAGELKKDIIQERKEEFIIESIASIKRQFLESSQVQEIEMLRQIYKKNIKRLSKLEFEKFEKAFFTELTYNSNAIEGNSLSLEETSLVVNDGLVPEGKTIRELYEAKNHAKALKYIKEYKGPINELFILKLHYIILEGISERFAGKYRQNPVLVIGSSAKFPSAHVVPQLMGNLIYWYETNKSKLHPFELAVIFSMKFVTIHPFIDGNGRVSRLLMNSILQKKDYPWINVYLKQRGEYLKAVRLANDEHYSQILGFLLRTLKENTNYFGFVE